MEPAKVNVSPYATKTEESIMPTGGQIKPAIIMIIPKITISTASLNWAFFVSFTS